MNSVEAACVTTIAFMSPSLLAKGGAASVATPMIMLDIPKIGPLNASEIPYLSPNHAVIRGTTMPAPKEIMALVKTYFDKRAFDFRGRHSIMLAAGFSLFDSLTLSIINVETKLNIAITT